MQIATRRLFSVVPTAANRRAGHVGVVGEQELTIGQRLPITSWERHSSGTVPADDHVVQPRADAVGLGPREQAVRIVRRLGHGR